MAHAVSRLDCVEPESRHATARAILLTTHLVPVGSEVNLESSLPPHRMGIRDGSSGGVLDSGISEIWHYYRQDSIPATIDQLRGKGLWIRPEERIMAEASRACSLHVLRYVWMNSVLQTDIISQKMNGMYSEQDCQCAEDEHAGNVLMPRYISWIFAVKWCPEGCLW